MMNVSQPMRLFMVLYCFISTIVVYSLKTGYAVAKIVICKDNEVESKKY